jgi:hypothetical protein
LANTHWSKDFSIQSGGTAGALELQDTQNSTVYEFKVHISLAWGVFKRTKVVTFVPRFVLVNHMKYAVRVKQVAKKKYEKKGLLGPSPNPSPATTPTSTPDKEEKEKKKGGGLSFFGHKKDKHKEEEKEKVSKERKEIAEDKVFLQ